MKQTMTSQIPLLSLKAQHERLAPELRQAVLKVVDSGTFIMGPEVEGIEKEIAGICGVKHAVGVSSGSEVKPTVAEKVRNLPSIGNSMMLGQRMPRPRSNDPAPMRIAAPRKLRSNPTAPRI